MYLLFGQLEGYATGGAHDLLQMSSDILVLELRIENDFRGLLKWWHIFSLEDKKIVKRSPLIMPD